jgi:hypothetical protein
MAARVERELDGATIVDFLHVARTHRDRMRGLLGRRDLDEREGMWFPRCRMIHTVGMAFPIDVVYLDRRHEVRKVVEALRPGRLSACLAARSVLELSSGACRRLGLKPGARLRIVE